MESKEQWHGKLSELGTEDRESLTRLFTNCPAPVIAAMQIIRVPEGYHLIEAGTPCNVIYIILKGAASGMDYQLSGNLYLFVEFAVADVLGDYEILGDISAYRVSIRTASECELAVIPAALYLDWMRGDANALFIRTRKLMNTLTIQTSEARRYLFLSCRERLSLYLIESYRRAGQKDACKLDITQAELAERVGFTVRTIQRTMAGLEKDGMIRKEAGKIWIADEQYHLLLQYTKHHFKN